MKSWGLFLVGIGLLVAFGALVMNTSVASSIEPYALTESRTYNLGLLQRQELIFMGGCAMFVAGCVVSALGELDNTLRHRGAANIVGDGPHDAAMSNDAPPVQIVAPAIRDETQLTHPVEEVDTKIWIFAAIVAGLILTAFLMFLNRTSASTAPVDARMPTENLTMEADNIESQYR